MPVVVYSNHDYADEFNLFGFRIYESIEAFKDDLKSWKEAILESYNEKYPNETERYEREYKAYLERLEERRTNPDLPYPSYPKSIREIEFSFGTNEWFTFSPKDILSIDREFTVLDLSQESYDELMSIGFNYGGFWLLDRG